MVSDLTHRFPRRFVYHGNAVGAEVFLTKVGKVEQRIVHPVDGQSSLPVIGGHSESPPVTPDFQNILGEVFGYREAQTMADGQLDRKGAAITSVQASVKEVRVTNWPAEGESETQEPVEFRAGALALAMRSRHPQDSQPRIEFSEPPNFQDLSFKGLPVKLKLNTELMRLTRWSDLEERFRGDRKFFDRCRDSFSLPDPKRPLAFGQKIPLAAGTFALCSFVRSITWGARTIPGHVLTDPGFGTIYFGEILLNDRERRVTMVRMHLGSRNKGQAVFAETDPNGTWWPPRKPTA